MVLAASGEHHQANDRFDQFLASLGGTPLTKSDFWLRQLEFAKRVVQTAWAQPVAT